MIVEYVSSEPREGEAFVRWLHQRTSSLLKREEVWQAVQLVAQALLAEQVLGSRPLHRYVKQAWTQTIENERAWRRSDRRS